MELTVPKKDLLKLVTRMQGVAERKSTMPVLSNVLLAVDGPSALRIAATDLYLALVGRVTVDVSKGGSVAVSAKDLLERVRMMPDGPIHLASQDNATTTIKAAGSARRYTLRGMPGDDFPPLPAPVGGVAVAGARRRRPAGARREDALLDLDGRDARAPELGALRVGRRHRAHGDDRRSPPLEDGGQGQRPAGVGDDAHPAQGHPGAAAPVRRHRRRGEGEREGRRAEGRSCRSRRAGRARSSRAGGCRSRVRLVDAQFPPYAQVIPQQSEKLVRVPRAAFADALRAVSVAASERTGRREARARQGHDAHHDRVARERRGLRRDPHRLRRRRT